MALVVVTQVLYTTMQVAPGFFPFQIANPIQPFFKDRYPSQRFYLERDKNENFSSHRSEETRPQEDIYALLPRNSSLGTYPPELHTLRIKSYSPDLPTKLIAQYLIRWEDYEPQHDDCGLSRSYSMLPTSSRNMKKVSVLLLRPLLHPPLRNLAAALASRRKT